MLKSQKTLINIFRRRRRKRRLCRLPRALSWLGKDQSVHSQPCIHVADLQEVLQCVLTCHENMTQADFPLLPVCPDHPFSTTSFPSLLLSGHVTRNTLTLAAAAPPPTALLSFSTQHTGWPFKSTCRPAFHHHIPFSTP